ncbi:MAG: nitroreductase family deazaflavin-dependent oxidoreductase [Gammaproteobacteria bacterium]|nr:nitroreductase family deazaflavin-dependent oxidoreductase [Gammaproteobacteria bacterium]
MKAVKIIIVVAVIYALIVVLFESTLGFTQPSLEGTMVVTTTGDNGAPHDRVVQRLESGGQLYIAANHWPRAWYRQALKNPEVQITFDGETQNYQAVPVIDAEHDRVDADTDLGLVFKILTGFPPRYFVRLDPR